jgi:hypothetical protein
MEPLDLETSPPRGPREQLLGVCFLPRTIDKIRAELPGGKTGGYLVAESTMSSYVLHKIGVKLDELRDVVARADAGETGDHPAAPSRPRRPPRGRQRVRDA